jgi:5-aminolevulinate synthase
MGECSTGQIAKEVLMESKHKHKLGVTPSPPERGPGGEVLSILEQKLAVLQEQGAYRYFLEVNKSAQHFPDFYYRDEQGHQHKATNWCSNDYLAQSTHEEVIAKLSFTTHRSGTGSGGTRNISGTTIHHRELETTLATWHKKEAALLFNGAYAANHTTLQTLGRHIPDLIFLSDEKNHASLIEGIRASGNLKFIFRHNNVTHLEELLAKMPLEQPKVIVFESDERKRGARARPGSACQKIQRAYLRG